MAERRTIAWVRVLAALLALALLPAAAGASPLAPLSVQLDFSAVVAEGGVVYDNAAHAGLTGLAFRGADAPNLPVTGMALSVGYKLRGAGDETAVDTPPTEAGEYTLVIKSLYGEVDSPYEFVTSPHFAPPLGATVTYFEKRTALEAGGVRLAYYGFRLDYDFAIARRELKVAAEDKEMVCGRQRPEFTYTVKNLAPGHKEKDALVRAPVLECVANTKKPGQWPIVVKEAETTANYTLKAVEGTLTAAEPSFGLGLSPQGTHAFATVQRGYAAVAPLEAVFTNTGTGDLTGLSVSLMGANTACFTLDGTTSQGFLGPEESMRFTVRPVDGLAEGSYTARVYVNASAEQSGFFEVSFTVGAVYAAGANNFGIRGGHRFTPRTGAAGTQGGAGQAGGTGAGGAGGTGGAVGGGWGTGGAGGAADGSAGGSGGAGLGSLGGLSGGTGGAAAGGSGGSGGAGGAVGGIGRDDAAGAAGAGGGPAGAGADGAAGTGAGGSGGAGIGSGGAGTGGAGVGTGGIGQNGAGAFAGGLYDLQVLDSTLANALTPEELAQDGLPAPLAVGERLAVLAEDGSLRLDGEVFSSAYDLEAGAYILTAQRTGSGSVAYIDPAGQSTTFELEVAGSGGQAGFGALLLATLTNEVTLACAGGALGLCLLVLLLRRRRRKKQGTAQGAEADEYWNW